jgi:hypothetical protein
MPQHSALQRFLTACLSLFSVQADPLYPFASLIAAVNAGRTSWRSPTIP